MKNQSDKIFEMKADHFKMESAFSILLNIKNQLPKFT